MRLLSLRVTGHRKLRDLTIDFSTQLTTVMIGENGTGKSTILEVIADIFKRLDFQESPPTYGVELTYRINNVTVKVSNPESKWEILVGEDACSLTQFVAQELLPDMIFGYYSGDNNRLESIFERHQTDYYKWVRSSASQELLVTPPKERRLFFCRPIHGVLALITSFMFPDDAIHDEYKELLKIEAFHQALFLLREPWWTRGSVDSFWGATGRPAEISKWLEQCSFFPIVIKSKVRDDYRASGSDEEQYALFLNGQDSLDALLTNFAEVKQKERVVFESLESLDISGLYRWVQVWLSKRDEQTGEVSFGDLSDGERQVLMVLGLLWVSTGRNTLFLLDEPDTHLNPAWQLRYLDLIQKWARFDKDNCQVIMATHNPLTIASLSRDDVRVLVEQDGELRASRPFTDPLGLGFSSILTEVFGLPSTLDSKTQKDIDRRNELARIGELTSEQEIELANLSQRLDKLGFAFTSREPLYNEFLRAWNDVRYQRTAGRSPEELANRRKAMTALIKQLTTPEVPVDPH
ncbi:MAG: AAA family ATPase [Methanoregulaceae archaeon]|nr:AAA family ATPase [Methanoregulaceae archaeon]